MPYVGEPDDRIFYDGALRDPHKVLERIERDLYAYLRQAVSEFERDDSAWLALLEGLVPLAVLARGLSIEISAEGFTLRPSFEDGLDAAFAALSKQPWCLSPRFVERTIEM